MVKICQLQVSSGIRLTSQQVKYSNAKGGGEASAEAGTEPSQACQHHQAQ